MKFILPVFAALALLAGCHTPGPFAPQSEKHPGLDESTATVALMDERVQTSVTSAGDRGMMQPDGRLKVSVNLKNRESRPITVQVRCVFKDAQGFGIDDETSWGQITLTENAT